MRTFHCNSGFRIPHSAFLRPRRHNFGYVDRGRIGRFASVRSGIRTDPSQWTDERHRRGIAGEEQAIRYLLSRGCTIVAHRFRVGHTEIDLIARQGDLVTFVEVKTRRGRAFGSPRSEEHTSELQSRGHLVCRLLLEKKKKKKKKK